MVTGWNECGYFYRTRQGDYSDCRLLHNIPPKLSAFKQRHLIMLMDARSWEFINSRGKISDLSSTSIRTQLRLLRHLWVTQMAGAGINQKHLSLLATWPAVLEAELRRDCWLDHLHSASPRGKDFSQHSGRFPKRDGGSVYRVSLSREPGRSCITFSDPVLEVMQGCFFCSLFTQNTPLRQPRCRGREVISTFIGEMAKGT